MKRRGFSEDIPAAPRRRVCKYCFQIHGPASANSRLTVPPRLGGPVPPSRSLQPDEQRISDPEIQIYEDQAEEDAAAIACADDIDPPDRSDDIPFQPLSINILGVNYSPNAPLDTIDDDIEFNGSDGGDDENKENEVGVGEERTVAKANIQHIEATEAAQSPPAQAEPAQSVERVADGPSDGAKPVDEFHLAMMLFVTASDISTSQYQALIEVLELATPENLHSLPRSVKTLRENCRTSFPLSHMKSRPVKISLDVTPPKSETPRWAYYFDLSEYCRL